MVLKASKGIAATPFSGSGILTWDNEIRITRTLASQTTEGNSQRLTLTTDSTFVSGTDITYSSAYGSSNLKLTGTFTGASGAFSNIYSVIDANVNWAAAGDGVIGIKSVVRSTDIAITDGNLFAGQFIAKKAGSGVAAAEVAVVGVEGWFMETGSGEVRTGIGGNFGWHADSSDAGHVGAVWRGVQIFCDSTGTSSANEQTGLCIWNMAGTQDNAINIVNTATGFTNFALFTDDGKPAASTSSTVSAIGTKGYIKVKVGTATRYIGLSETVS